MANLRSSTGSYQTSHTFLIGPPLIVTAFFCAVYLILQAHTTALSHSVAAKNAQLKSSANASATSTELHALTFKPMSHLPVVTASTPTTSLSSSSSPISDHSTQGPGADSSPQAAGNTSSTAQPANNSGMLPVKVSNGPQPSSSDSSHSSIQPLTQLLESTANKLDL